MGRGAATRVYVINIAEVAEWFKLSMGARGQGVRAAESPVPGQVLKDRAGIANVSGGDFFRVKKRSTALFRALCPTPRRG